jgi:lipid II:glycine glycyltransferase (peptidoglycan interpeptide bridge formation enzyme)
MNIEIINPLEYPNWDNLLLTNERSSFFHTYSWAKTLTETYHYKPLYFTKINNGNLISLIPIMEVSSFLTGKRGVSLPFTDNCQVIVNNKNDFDELFKKIIRYGKKAHWKTIELRGGQQYLSDKQPSKIFMIHKLDLLKSEKRIWSGFRDSTKRNIKKAVKTNMEVKVLHSFFSIKEFYRLNCLTRKDHGIPPQPFSFFKKIFDNIISKNNGYVLLAFNNGSVIAGAIYFTSNNKVIYKYGASDKKYQELRANNLIMWKSIQLFHNNGSNTFCFGKTELRNDGLLQFKRGWGVQEDKLNYYTYDIKKESFVNNLLDIETSYLVFKKMPITLLKLTGRIFYRHFG